MNFLLVNIFSSEITSYMIYCFMIQMPSLNSDLLKQSGIGKAVMMLYRHPKETRKNKEKAGKLISKLVESLPQAQFYTLAIVVKMTGPDPYLD